MKTKYAIFVVLVPLIFASCVQHYATERTITVRNGATGVDSLSFKYEDEAKAVKCARTLAIENARAIAEESVQAAGATLGKVLIMQERNGSAMLRQNFASNSLSQSWNGGAIMYEAWAAEEDAGGAATPLSTGRKEITVVMDMLYELK